MRVGSILLIAAGAVALSACATAVGVAGTAVGAAGTAAGVAGSVVATTAEATGDVIGVAARTVTGGGSHESK